MCEQYVRSAFGRATQLSRRRARADACPGAAWPALRNGNDSLFLCDITCVRHAVEKRRSYVRMCVCVREYAGTYASYMCASEDTFPTLCHVEKGGEHVISHVPGSGFAVSRPRRSCENRKQSRRYYDIDRSPFEPTHLFCLTIIRERYFVTE